MNVIIRLRGKKIRTNTMNLFSKKSQDKCVLIADDVATIRAIVSGPFKKAKYRIVEARNGDEVISSARTHHPNLIVLDLQMGNRGGVSALDELLLDRELGRIPVVVLSGETDETIIKRVKNKSNVVDYISKDNLTQVIENLEKHVK